VTDALDRRNRLAAFAGPRGSMLLVTERRQAVGPIVCEVCNACRSGGIARGVVLDEPGGDTVWLLWVLADGWSLADHSQIAVCPEHQADKLLKTLRFARPEPQ
jgi:hypothetical protein